MARGFSLLLVLFLLGCSSGSGEKPSADEPSASTKGDEALLLAGREKPSEKAETPKGKDADRQTITFLNSQGTGRHFCIIADHSLSLSPASLGLIKREIVKTLRSLDERSAFNVMFFAKTPLPMPGGGWKPGTKENVDKAEEWMATVDREYGTLPAPAFRKALALEPRPDVIFFMTDGLLHPPARAAEMIGEINHKEPKVPINTILFTKKAAVVAAGTKARDDLEIIARESGGKYHQFIDPEALPRKKK